MMKASEASEITTKIKSTFWWLKIEFNELTRTLSVYDNQQAFLTVDVLKVINRTFYFRYNESKNAVELCVI